jgi:hypothetical protein
LDPVIGDLPTSVFGLDDDVAGSVSRTFLDWDTTKEEWQMPPRIDDPGSPFADNPYNVVMEVGEHDGPEGRYTLFFNVVFTTISETPGATPPGSSPGG